MLLSTVNLYSQVTIGEGMPPQKFSILEIVSNSQGGLRLPHLTTLEREAISNSSEFQNEKHRGSATPSIEPGLGLGLTIYNTDTNCTEYWNGYKWVSLCLGTANIILSSPCGEYDPQNPPMQAADGMSSGCEYTPEDLPKCTVTAGKAYDVYLTTGSSYANIIVDDLTSTFKIEFAPNNSAFVRNAIVRVVNNCTGEFKDFIFSQMGATCPQVTSPPILNETTLSLCQDGSSFAYVKNAEPGIEYIWTYAGVVVHTGNWYEIKRAGTYNVYPGLLGCDPPATLTVLDKSNVAPSAIQISATNEGILCAGGNVLLTANTSQNILWFHNGIPLSGSNKNLNPLPLSGSEAQGNWFAIVNEGDCMSSSSNTITLIDYTMVSNALSAPQASVNGQSLTEDDIVVCKNGTLKLEITNSTDYIPGTEYEWFINGKSIAKSTSPIIYYVAPNIYNNVTLSVTVSDQSGNCPNTAISKNSAVKFSSPSTTSINNGAQQTAICGAMPATLIAGKSGAVEYEWMKEGFTIPGNDQILRTQEQGNYTVRYKDINGCWSQISSSISVIQSAPIIMTWMSKPGEVVKGDVYTFSVATSPIAPQYEWSYRSSNANAVVSINPIGNGSSAVVIFGNPDEIHTDVTITVKTKGHSCGDVTISQDVVVKDGCTKATSVNLIPNGTFNITEGESLHFEASSNASNNNNDLRFVWEVISGSITIYSSGPTPGNAFDYTPPLAGTYKIRVSVTNDCTEITDLVMAEATINVKPNKDQYTPDNSGKFTLEGKECFDVAQSNFGPKCGSQEDRPGDFLDGSRNWIEGKQWIYTFTANGAYTNLQFVTDDPSILIKSEISSVSSRTLSLIFDESVLNKALGKDKNNALYITIYALFEYNGVKMRAERKISIQDCWCGCGAYVQPNVWKAFMCHNLGSDETLDPFIPNKGLHGAKYKYGQPRPALSMEEDQNDSAPIPNWNSLAYQSSGTWLKHNDPCPKGYRLPTTEEWDGVLKYNTKKNHGSWTSNINNYESGCNFGDNLFLPTAGLRYNNTGRLGDRGIIGMYWSSNYGYFRIYDNSGQAVQISSAIDAGLSVKCIAD